MGGAVKTLRSLVTVGVVILGLCTWTVRSQTLAEAQALRKQMFDTNGYDKKIRPADNQSAVLSVWIELTIRTINELDEVAEVMKSTGYIVGAWKDSRLTWNSTSFNMTYQYWPQGDVWRPDLCLLNNFLKLEDMGMATSNVINHNDGWIYWYPFQVFESVCSIDITYFPFDKQTCDIIISAWSYTPNEVEMYSGDKGIFMGEYEESASWAVDDYEYFVDSSSVESKITFRLYLHRKPLFVVISIVLPCAMLAILNIFTFLLPCETGEKSGYAITVFLALAVFLTIIAQTLPANSDSISLFSVYLIIQTVQSTVITLISLVQLRLHNFGDDVPVPRIFVHMARGRDSLHRSVKRLFGKCFCYKKNNKVTNIKRSENEKGGNSSTEKVRVSVVDMKDDTKSVTTSTSSSSSSSSSSSASSDGQDPKEPKLDWKEAMNVSDFYFFFFFMLSFIFSSMGCFLGIIYPI